MSLRGGKEYLASLDDQREVWMGGQRVRVKEHPRLAPLAQALADIYDLQHNPDCGELLTVTSPDTGQRISRAYHLPESSADLIRAREMFELLERRCGGVLGRFPQYMGFVLMGLYNVRPQIEVIEPEFAENIAKYFRFCRENDLFLTFAFTDPPRDKRIAASKMEYLRVIEHRPDGIIIRGVKAVATSAPYADEYLGLTVARPDLTADEVIYFSLPVATRGLRIVCREPYVHPQPGDHPIATAYDEIDSWMIFDDVFVPRERIFFLGHPELAGNVHAPIPTSWGFFFGVVRMAVKLEVLTGICYAITDYLGTNDTPQTDTLLAELAVHLESLRMAIHYAEEHPIVSPAGFTMPNLKQTMLARIMSLEMHPRVLQIVRELCGSGILMAPGDGDLSAPEIGAILTHYTTGADERARDRFKMMRLAWEYACDSFGSRQLLFEMYNAGTLPSNRANFLKAYDATPLVRLAKDLAGIER